SIVKSEFVRYMFHIEVDQAPDAEEQRVADVGYSYQDQPVQGVHAADAAMSEAELEAEALGEASPQPARAAAAVVEQRVVAEEDKVGRNDPCPCGSGKKYKRCHGA